MFDFAHPIFNRPEGAEAGILIVLKSLGHETLDNKRVTAAVSRKRIIRKLRGSLRNPRSSSRWQKRGSVLEFVILMSQ